MPTKLKIALAAAILLGTASAAAGGRVMPCSLDGVNPHRHHKIFRHPAVAGEYGFVRSAGDTWLVEPNCHR
ncbi:MAG TPA: hypothetical protein VGN55_11135 [Xanthobacteraceae bacterium]|jgi:hypothetical protein